MEIIQSLLEIEMAKESHVIKPFISQNFIIHIARKFVCLIRLRYIII